MTLSGIGPAFVFVAAILSAAIFLFCFIHLFSKILHNSGGSAPVTQPDDPEMARSNSFERQLQQLFRLHDSGLDQAFIDALPVFLYRDVDKGGLKLEQHFDCAVCLCEFTEHDKLRLLPPCHHAFHIECIDTWLLSNSTCPLCRGSLYCSLVYWPADPIPETDNQGEDVGDGYPGIGDGRIVVSSKRVLSVRLGKLRGGIPDRGSPRITAEETSSSSLDARRCYSMGSYRYVVSDTELRVETREEGHGSRKFGEGRSSVVRSKGESFSVSKIWQLSNKKRNPSCQFESH